MPIAGRRKDPPIVDPDDDLARRSGQALADLAAETAPGVLKPGDDLAARQEALIDEAVEETFPASDPIASKRII